MKKSEWIENLRKHLAIASVGNTTLMMQSGKDRVARTQLFIIKNIQLSQFSRLNENGFKKYLNKKTIALSKQLLRPDNNQPNWGAARKVLNIYLRQCAMNKDLNKYFRLKNVEPYLEVPLDNHIVKKIDKKSKTAYSKSFRIRTLNKTKNRELQDLASTLASKEKLYRYQLDVLFWNNKKLNA